MTGAAWPEDTWVEPTYVPVDDGVSLATRLVPGDRRPFFLVHGLASNALLWREVANRLSAAGHAVVAVDLRAHGRSQRTPDGHTTAGAARDLGRALMAIGWQDRRPVLVGQSWGGNVVLRAAGDDDAWSGVVAVDGGWIHLGRQFDTFDQCWQHLAPPDFLATSPQDVLGHISAQVGDWPGDPLGAVAGNLEVVDGRVRNRLPRTHHRQILHSLWSDDPADRYPRVSVPVHLMVAGSDRPDAVAAAERQLSDVTVSVHAGAHHDLHLQQPDVVAGHLLDMVQRVEGSSP